MSELLCGFGDLPNSFTQRETSRFVVIPVAYDGTSTWIKGADKGPAAVLEASANMELFDIPTGCEPYRQGIYTHRLLEGYDSPESMAADVRQAVTEHLQDGRFCITLGGEHSVSIGAMQAMVDEFGGVTFLQLDAHSDFRDEYEGSRYNHACVMARAKELGNIVQVGIRSMDVSEFGRVDKESLFLADEIHGTTDWIDRVLDRLTGPVYLTVDLDVFDPSIMPSTGTPEPGGLSWYPVMTLLRRVASERELVGMDVVELCPNPANKAPDFLAAKLIYSTLAALPE